jgi:Rrf2 family transcriptional regulator, iron-sulfur cluster assembly transcription factor
MRLTTRSRIAVAAITDLALRQAAGPVSLVSISQRQRVSLSYLEQLFAKLRKQGLVEAARGPGGGYVLRRPTTNITMADIVTAVDAADTAEQETLQEGPEGVKAPAFWDRLSQEMLTFLSSVTLEQLVEEQVQAGRAPTSVPTPATLARKKGVFDTAPALKPLRARAPNSVFALAESLGR